MKIFHTKKQLLAFYMPGFLFGILYVNLADKQLGADLGIFSEYFLKQYRMTEIIAAEYLWYLLRSRMIPFLALLGLAFTKFRKISVILFLIWTGFSSGVLMSMAVFSMGIRGIILCIVGIMPQFLFYIPAYLVVLWYSYTHPRGQWNIQKSIFTGLMVLLGLIMEVYVNPLLMKVFLGTL